MCLCVKGIARQLLKKLQGKEHHVIQPLVDDAQVLALVAGEGRAAEEYVALIELLSTSQRLSFCPLQSTPAHAKATR